MLARTFTTHLAFAFSVVVGCTQIIAGACAWSRVVNVPPLAAPQLGSCASSGHASRLRAAPHSKEEASPAGRPATASGAQAGRLQSRRFQRP